MIAPFTADELAYLVGRPPRAAVGPEERAAFAGRRVLITGAAGSIGSELARELAASSPAALGLLDQSELGLFTIEREIRARWPRVVVEACLVDVTRGAAVRRVVREIRPDVVYHAAAYKHVTMAERAPAAAARVNVIGSLEVATAAAMAGARFVLISSDKAADPESVMGATKRLAEMGTLALASRTFRPLVVRFGNVIGSSGSVVQIMREAVRSGRSVAITDPEATRYFMTAGEAVALVLRADVLGRAPEIYWLDMGDPVRLGDLADRMIALERAAGFAAPPVDIIGLRPGEKRNETLSDRHLTFQRTIDRRILVAREARRDVAGLSAALVRLRGASVRANDLAVLDVLSTVLDGFRPSGQARDAARRLVTGVVADSLKRRRQAA
jgi:FlaA1/EpsC-like NDP-sugar epimerase